jgi:hypothetical protein
LLCGEPNFRELDLMNSAKHRRLNNYLGQGSARAGGVLRWLVAVPGLAALACGGGGGGEASMTGQLLVGVQVSVGGVNYRLRNATLTGTGAEAFTLDTDDATQVAMSQTLAAGSYMLKLEDGWALERQSAGAFAAVPMTTLTSPNPVPFSVAVAQVARVGFAFDAAGVAVDLRQAADEGNDDNE